MQIPYNKEQKQLRRLSVFKSFSIIKGEHMTGLAIILVLTAAFGHATWNYLSKRANGGTAFIWLFAILSSLIYLPLAMWVLLVQKPVIGWTQIGFMMGSVILHSLYFILLYRGYRIGVLSGIYPLDRKSTRLNSNRAIPSRTPCSALKK